jgi:hypothetical protein
LSGKWGASGIERKESADKPGSVEDSHSSGTRVAARLKRPTREHARAARRSRNCLFPYLVLLRVGFTMPLMLPPARCALTAPFHPYLPRVRRGGGIFSVALSVDSRPPGVTWHPALWSPDFPPLPQAEGATVWPTPTLSLPESATPCRGAMASIGRGTQAQIETQFVEGVLLGSGQARAKGGGLAQRQGFRQDAHDPLPFRAASLIRRLAITFHQDH